MAHFQGQKHNTEGPTVEPSQAPTHCSVDDLSADPHPTPERTCLTFFCSQVSEAELTASQMLREANTLPGHIEGCGLLGLGV